MTDIRTLQSLARPDVRKLASYNAGLSIETVRERYGIERIAKLGSNENHFGPAPGVIEAIKSEAHRSGLYPDPNCGLLRAALAEKLGIEPGHFIFGNGSEDLLGIISRVFLDHGDEVVTVIPSFGLHFLYPQSVGAHVIGVPMTEDFCIDVDAVIAALSPRTRLLMFSCPSNPVGCALTGPQLQRILDSVPEQTLLVFDEAYFEYARSEADYPDCLAMIQASGKPFILLRTLSKAYALAGLRVGYGIVSDPALADLVDRLRTPFNVNRSAQAAAVAALTDHAHLHMSLQHVARERPRMDAGLRELGLQPVRSLANFLFFSTPFEAEIVNTELLSRGVIVKPWREPGYTRFLRVSVGSRQDNDLFLDAMASSLAALR